MTLILLPNVSHAEIWEKNFLQIIRKFVANSYRTFSRLLTDEKEEIISFSKEFRQQLLEYIIDLYKVSDWANSSELHELQVFLEDEHDRTSGLPSIWHLAEVFVMKSLFFQLPEAVSWLQSFANSNEESWCTETTRFEQLKYPETTEDDDSFEGYWSTLYRQCVRGRLDLVWTLLQQHSSISSVLQQQDERCDFRDLECLKELEEVFQSHPIQIFQLEELGREGIVADKAGRRGDGEYGAAKERGRDFGTDTSNDRYAALHFAWRQRVEKLWSSSYSLLATLPQLDMALRLMAGDIAVVNDVFILRLKQEYRWEEVAISRLMYSRTPLLSKRAVVEVIEKCYSEYEARKALQSRGGRNEDEDENEDDRAAEREDWERINDVMNGHVGTLIATLRTRVYTSPSLLYPYAAVVPALCALYFAYLLHSCGELDTSEVPEDGERLSRRIVEDLAVTAAEHLASSPLHLPPQLVASYLSAVPSPRTMICLGSILTRVPPPDDRSAMELVDSLRASGLVEAARSVLRVRSTWWLSQRGDRVKALQFLVEGGPEDRVGVDLASGLLEDCLEDCVAAVLAEPLFRRHLTHVPIVNRPSPARPLPLEDMLMEAEAMLAAGGVGGGGKKYLSVPALWLDNYIQGVGGLMHYLRDGDETLLARAVQALCDAALREWAAPDRLKLHLIDLALWMDSIDPDLVSALYPSRHPLQAQGSTSGTGPDLSVMDTDTEPSLAKRAPRRVCRIARETVLALMRAVERLDRSVLLQLSEDRPSLKVEEYGGEYVTRLLRERLLSAYFYWAVAGAGGSSVTGDAKSTLRGLSESSAMILDTSNVEGILVGQSEVKDPLDEFTNGLYAFPTSLG